MKRASVMAAGAMAAALLLSACQSLPVDELTEESPSYRVPVGSKLIQHQPVVVPSNQASVWFQDGLQIPSSQIRRYYPYCKYELWEIRQRPQTIEPDTFDIFRVGRDSELVLRSGTIQLAQARIGIGVGIGTGVDSAGGGPAFEIPSTLLYLRSERHPNVYRITCESWQDIYRAEPLTIAEVRAALGDAFTLALAR